MSTFSLQTLRALFLATILAGALTGRARWSRRLPFKAVDGSEATIK
jgi:hypothetical protein